jgi:predicted HAD superfamily Cof-like phosphohydrolase/predicted RNA-binding Zn-ribbon protein involved in translation (DUF1610 family)
MSKDWVADIRAMHEKHGAESDQYQRMLPFRVDFLEEELQEIRKAETAEDVVDGLIDLCVVAIGTMDLYDVDAYEAWNRVLKANMGKEPGVNPTRLNLTNIPDLVKPEGWEPPSMEGLVGKLDKIQFGEGRMLEAEARRLCHGRLFMCDSCGGVIGEKVVVCLMTGEFENTACPDCNKELAVRNLKCRK